LQAFAGHIDWVQSLVFVQEAGAPATAAPLLYSAGDDGRVLEWKYEFPVRSREVIRVPYAVRSISVSADQKLLAIGGFSEEILIWDLATNTLRHRLNCDCSDQRCVRFSPDGSRVLCGGRDGEVVVWDTQTGSLLASAKLHGGRIKTAGFSVDGSRVTSVGEDRQVIRFDVATGEVVFRRELGKAKLHALCLVNDSLVAAAGSDNRIRLYDAIADGVVAELEGHTGTVAVLVPCGEFLASGSFDTTVRIWDLEAIGRGGAAGHPVNRAPLKMDAELRIR
jgi:WD40 repeat protein